MTETGQERYDGDEELRQLVAERVAAVQAKNPRPLAARQTEDVVVFDVLPPLHSRGSAAVEEKTKAWFDAYAGNIGYDVRDLHVSADGDVGFSTDTEERDRRACGTPRRPLVPRAAPPRHGAGGHGRGTDGALPVLAVGGQQMADVLQTQPPSLAELHEGQLTQVLGAVGASSPGGVERAGRAARRSEGFPSARRTAPSGS